jgi:hypothetical protein
MCNNLTEPWYFPPDKIPSMRIGWGSGNTSHDCLYPVTQRGPVPPAPIVHSDVVRCVIRSMQRRHRYISFHKTTTLQQAGLRKRHTDMPVPHTCPICEVRRPTYTAEHRRLGHLAAAFNDKSAKRLQDLEAMRMLLVSA